MSAAHYTDADQLVVFRDGEHRLKESFTRFDRENPHVYASLVRLARRWRTRKGPDATCGIGMLYEVLRWELGLQTIGEPIRLNNNYRAFYARKIMRSEPGLQGVFDIRRQRDES